TNITILPQIAQNPQNLLADKSLPQIAQIFTEVFRGCSSLCCTNKAIGHQHYNSPTEHAEHTETTGGEEKSVYICEIRGRLFSARSFCVFCEIRGRISSTRNFCEFREFRGRTCANKLGMGSVEGIRRAAWVWQGCH
ncbi:hypothetical protein HMPREF0673_02614, partial [Leyella stercorea DSM 18206]